MSRPRGTASWRGDPPCTSGATSPPRGMPTQVACRVDDAIWGDHVPERRRRGRDLALRAAREALHSAGLIDLNGAGTAREDPSRVAVVVGTTMGESGALRGRGRARSGPRPQRGDGMGRVRRCHRRPARLSRARAGSSGRPAPPGTTPSGAARRVESGRRDVVVAAGVEPFSRIAMLGFARMRAMAPTGCTPFGAGRRGMTLGEGAGVLVIESLAHAEARRAPGPWRSSAGSGSPPTPATRPLPSRTAPGMAAAMRAGLTAAGVGLGPRLMGWVSAHGTGLRARTRPRHVPCTRSSASSVTRPGVVGQGRARAHPRCRDGPRGRARRPGPGTGWLPPGSGGGVVRDRRGARPRRRDAGPPAPGALLGAVAPGYAFGGLNSALLLGRAA